MLYLTEEMRDLRIQYCLKPVEQSNNTTFEKRLLNMATG